MLALWTPAGPGPGVGVGLGAGPRILGSVRGTSAAVSRRSLAMCADFRNAARTISARRADRDAADASAGGVAVCHGDRHCGGPIRRVRPILRRSIREGGHA